MRLFTVSPAFTGAVRLALTSGFTGAAWIVLAMAGTAPTALTAQTPEAPVASDTAARLAPPATLEELSERISRLIDSTNTPGAGLAIVRNDSIIMARGFGLARVAPERMASAATLFRIGSTSKAFVALAAMQLQREGKLSIDDPISTHIPDFWFKNEWEDTDPVRIVHLLEHTSGFNDNSLRAYANSDPAPLTLAQGLAVDTSTRVSRWRPGTHFSYSNTGPAVVALIIERIENKSFEDVIQERFFTPLGMETATYMYPDTSRLEVADLYKSDGKTVFPYWHVFARPAGSINASANDMAQYLRFLLGRGTIGNDTILLPGDIQRMESSGTWIGTRSGLDVTYGLHLYRTADSTGFIWTSHNGGVEGGLSDLSYIPEAGIGYAFQINSGDGSVMNQIARLVRSFLTQQLPRPSEPPVAAVPEYAAEQFAGWYRMITPRQKDLYFLDRIADLKRISFRGDSMHVRTITGSSRAYVAVDSLLFREPGSSAASIAFSRDEQLNRHYALGFGFWTSAIRISQLSALSTIAFTVGWFVAVLAGLIAVILVPVRWAVRTVRKRPLAPSPARPLWRVLMLASVLVLIPILAVMISGGELAQLGNLTPVSGTLFVSGWLIAAWSVVGLVCATRKRMANTKASRVSIWVARAFLVLHFIGAAYFTYWGPIGWKMW